MFVVNSVNGELYKLRASDAKEQQFWITQLQACARRHSDSSAKVNEPTARMILIMLIIYFLIVVIILNIFFNCCYYYYKTF
uniref:PH domain-containing protein n=1 Tax=Cynoglossus semilaevis TaxID=244447 RepID=A0A3P8VPQ2_CYNSE